MERLAPAADQRHRTRISFARFLLHLDAAVLPLYADTAKQRCATLGEYRTGDTGVADYHPRNAIIDVLMWKQTHCLTAGPCVSTLEPMRETNKKHPFLFLHTPLSYISIFCDKKTNNINLLCNIIVPVCFCHSTHYIYSRVGPLHCLFCFVHHLNDMGCTSQRGPKTVTDFLST